VAFRQHQVKVGIGAPPVLTRHGWLVIYQGVGGRLDRTKVHYSSRAMVLDPQHPEQIR
jgi:beta-1,2-mannobiose phosphorylase / 1,2-beta-oligomannan phosphorylase